MSYEIGKVYIWLRANVQMMAERGDLRPKNPPAGEASINSMFKEQHTA